MKFWFIKNYMSPQMKRFLPLMAQHYGFEYEFVTYKWPTWLHKQVSLLSELTSPAFMDLLWPTDLQRPFSVQALERN